MSNKTRALAALIATAAVSLTALTGCASTAKTHVGASRPGGLITIITGDQSSPYWKAEGDLAAAEAQKLGYTPKVASNNSSVATEEGLVKSAIGEHSVALILDPASGDGSIPAVSEAVAAGIPVFIVNAGISKDGLAKAQLTSNNNQGAVLGATEWAKHMKAGGEYVELLGNAADANAAIRSQGYASVLSKIPSLKLVGQKTADWSQQKGHDAMVGLIKKNPDLKGVIAGNDEMALGALTALHEAGRQDVVVGGFDGGPTVVKKIATGEIAYTILQPLDQFAKKAVLEVNEFLLTGTTGANSERQVFDCELVKGANVVDYTSPFVLR